ncbi:CDK-activating kinase assembly factor MAT1 [Nematocida displodere]|uniref:CDK-activating kinase assembly factor MAT1 n=1 Tax=Nematocida displodere TaxID=1805483 RepID=A0A177EB58_9MICR|nr:CDK-activating kinase assembly factor MAT1 [Nematocida displodere]
MKTSEVSCPKCKSNSYINPGIKIFVSPCYHSLCEMCVSRLFSNGPNECPECGITLRRSNYTSQTFEDVSVERDCRIRKTVISYLGKSLEDYSDEEEYNEYLEQIEDVVQELTLMKGTREMTVKLQELKEGAKPAETKRRKVDPAPGETSLKEIDLFFAVESINPDTVPDAVFYRIDKKQSVAELVKVMIMKASASLISSEI